MRKNVYAAHDFIRQGKFKTPEKMIAVEKLLETKRVVINWWCRQSGKTLTSIKIGRDIMVNTPGSVVLFVCPKMSICNSVTEKMARTIDRSLIKSTDATGLILKNGSIFKAGPLRNNMSLDPVIDKVDLLVIDEFEWMEETTMASLLLIIRQHIWPSMMQRFLRMFKEKKHTRVIMNSSKNDGKNFSMIKSSLPEIGITYFNWEKIPSLNREALIEKLGEESFEKEYNSYNP